MPITFTSTGINFDVGVQNKSVSGFALGVGTYWQNVTSSRAIDVSYTNSTGRPLAVFVIMAGIASNACVFQIDGVNISTTAFNGSGGGNSSVHCIVPTGSTYGINSPSWPLSLWFELRV